MIRPCILCLLCLCFAVACAPSGETGKEGASEILPSLSDLRFSMEIPDIFKDAAGRARAPSRIFVEASSGLVSDGTSLRCFWHVNDSDAGEGCSRWLDLTTSGTHRILLSVVDAAGNRQSHAEELVLEPGASLGVSGTLFVVKNTVSGRSVKGGEGVSDIIPGEMIVRFRDPDTGFRSSMGQEGWHALARRGDTVFLRVSAERSALASDRETAIQETLEAVKRMALREDVLRVEPNRRRRVASIPVNDAGYAEKPDRFWPLEAIGAPGAWEKTRGEGAVIAILDTGIVSVHPDLKDRIGPDGYDFVGGDSDPEDPGGGSSSFHGTQVAGIALATLNNETGMAGVAGRATLMPLRVIEPGGDVDTWALAQAIRYASGLSNASGRLPSKRADVINLSLGGEGENGEERDAVDAALKAGVLVVAAAGNDGKEIRHYPAGYPGVFAVGGVDRDLQRSSGSNYGDGLSLVAPWGPLYTTTASPVRKLPEYTSSAEGTSMATPFVSGVLALMRSHSPGLSPVQAMEILARGGMTRDLGVKGRDDATGWGLVDASLALDSLGRFFLSALPESLDMGISGRAAFLFLSQGNGAADLEMQKPLAPDWIRVTAEKINGSGFGFYRIEILREHPDFPSGGMKTHLEIPTSSGRLFYPVHVGGVPENPVSLPDTLVLLLEDVFSGEVRSVIPDREKRTQDGGYPWAVADLPAGRYRIRTEGGGSTGQYPSGSGQEVWLYPGALERDRLDFVVNIP